MVAADELLAIRDLRVEARAALGTTELLHGVSLVLRSGEMHGLVGETGSGKSMTAYAAVGLLPKRVHIAAGQVLLRGRDLTGLNERELRSVRGSQIGMVFQNPRTALHPMLSVGAQLGNVIESHIKMSGRERAARVRQYLSLAGISDAERVARAYPHELSGGMAQRAVIASALVCEPSILIADEPTTGLDVTVQGQILELLADLQRRLSLSVLMITHDLSIVAQYCHNVSVMHSGNVVEEGPSEQILRRPAAAYTQRLIEASRLNIRRGSVAA